MLAMSLNILCALCWFTNGELSICSQIMNSISPSTSDTSVPPSLSLAPSILPAPTITQNPSLSPTASSKLSKLPSFFPSTTPTTFPTNPIYKTKIGVYYYPWHGSDFHGGKYLREFLNPPQFPSLGEYDDTQGATIQQHYEWTLYAQISVWIASWWGPERRTDTILLDSILPHLETIENSEQNLQIAIHYETSGRTSGFADFSNVGSDIHYLTANYFTHPNYYFINGRPVIVIYLTRVMSKEEDFSIIQNFISLMRTAALDDGYDIYIIADEIFRRAPDEPRQAFDLYDAITGYDVYGSMMINTALYAGQETVDVFFEEQSKWRDLAHEKQVSYIPCITPGFNDKGVREGHFPLSRQLDNLSEHGSLFSAMAEQAIGLLDQSSDSLLFVTSFNEWHEDTQIEPVDIADLTNVDSSDSTVEYTMELLYEGYGTKYLDILRDIARMNRFSVNPKDIAKFGTMVSSDEVIKSKLFFFIFKYVNIFILILINIS